MTEGSNSPTGESQSGVNYISEDILEKICHKMASDLFADQEPMGLYADHDEARLKASLALSMQIAFGEELYKGIYRKAAILFYALNRNHAFGNGNKRLSVAALVVFLYINNIILISSDSALRDKALWLAQTTDSIESAVNHLDTWIQRNSLPRNEFEKQFGAIGS